VRSSGGVVCWNFSSSVDMFRRAGLDVREDVDVEVRPGRRWSPSGAAGEVRT